MGPAPPPSPRRGSVLRLEAWVRASGDPPLCPSSRGAGVGPPPARAQRLCVGPEARETLKWAATTPCATGGEDSRAPRPRGPGSRMSHARLPAGSRSRRRQQGDPVAVASRRPTAAPAPSPGRPDGSLRGAHWGQQVSLQARAPGKRCELRVVLRWELGAGLLTLRSRAHPVRTLFGEVCRASSTLFR